MTARRHGIVALALCAALALSACTSPGAPPTSPTSSGLPTFGASVTSVSVAEGRPNNYCQYSYINLQAGGAHREGGMCLGPTWATPQVVLTDKQVADFRAMLDAVGVESWGLTRTDVSVQPKDAGVFVVTLGIGDQDYTVTVASNPPKGWPTFMNAVDAITVPPA